MTKPLKLLPLTALLLVSLAAQADEGDWYIAPSFIYADDDPDRAVTDAFAGLSFTLGRNMTEHLSLEGMLGYNDWDSWLSPPTARYPDQFAIDLSANLLYFPNRKMTFAPYLLAGIGYLGVDRTPGSPENNPSATAGVGFNWRMGQSNFSIRGDARYRHAYDTCSANCQSRTDFIGSLGIQYSFGGDSDSSIPVAATSAPEPAAYQDSDHDGVTDDRDRCPGTVAGAKVDLNGCEIPEVIDLKNIYFGFDSDVLHPASKRLLDHSASILSRHPDLQIEIAGYADISGPERYNMGLSQRRAEAVRAYVEQAGVNPANLTVRGYGESNSATHAENRRVELRITKR